jgi:hypothetical protein
MTWIKANEQEKKNIFFWYLKSIYAFSIDKNLHTFRSPEQSSNRTQSSNKLNINRFYIIRFCFPQIKKTQHDVSHHPAHSLNFTTSISKIQWNEFVLFSDTFEITGTGTGTGNYSPGKKKFPPKLRSGGRGLPFWNANFWGNAKIAGTFPTNLVTKSWKTRVIFNFLFPNSSWPIFSETRFLGRQIQFKIHKIVLNKLVLLCFQKFKSTNKR